MRVNSESDMSAVPEILLGVNVDHIATLRQARGTDYPDPVAGALLAEQSGADSITVHLREDRRHIQDRDLPALQEAMATRMNLELAVTDEMISIAENLRPADGCFVPERREELTTEGGLEVAAQLARVTDGCVRLQEQGIRAALFIDPDPVQIDAARQAGAEVIELHTGAFADATSAASAELELDRIRQAAAHGTAIGLKVHAGHGLNTANVEAVAAIPEILELNIGHSIIAAAITCGLARAVADIKRLMQQARVPGTRRS